MINVLLIILFALACLNLAKWADIILGFLETEIDVVEFTGLDIILLVASALYIVWFLIDFSYSFMV